MSQAVGGSRTTHGSKTQGRGGVMHHMVGGSRPLHNSIDRGEGASRAEGEGVADSYTV